VHQGRDETIRVGTNVVRFRGGLVLKAHRWLYYATLGSRVTKKKKNEASGSGLPSSSSSSSLLLASLELSDTKFMSLKYDPASEPLHISVK